jgi:hypothetical protein
MCRLDRGHEDTALAGTLVSGNLEQLNYRKLDKIAYITKGSERSIRGRIAIGVLIES